MSQCCGGVRSTPAKVLIGATSDETAVASVRDEVGDELEPVRSAIENVGVSERDEDPATQLGHHGFCDVAGDPMASGMAAGPPDATVDLDRNGRGRPGKVRPVGRGLTRPQVLLLLPDRPGVPGGEGVFPHKGEVGEGHEPLIGEGLLQMAAHCFPCRSDQGG